MKVLTNQQIQWTEAERDYLTCALTNVLGPIIPPLLEELWKTTDRNEWETQLLKYIPPFAQSKVRHILSWVIPNEVFLERCKNSLTHCIGVMGLWLLEEYQEDLSSKPPHVWIEVLANQIPDRPSAERFRSLTLIFTDEDN